MPRKSKYWKDSDFLGMTPEEIKREKYRLKSAAYRKANPKRYRELQRKSHHKHKEKRNAISRAYYSENRDRMLARQKERDALRIDERKAYQKEYQKKNRSRLRKYMRQYIHSDMPGAVRLRQTQPERMKRHVKTSLTYHIKHRARQAKRRAIIKSNSDAELVQITYLLERQEWECGICQGPILSIKDSEIDHRIPLSCGGKHIRSNLQAAHKICNRIKRGTHPLLMPNRLKIKIAKQAEFWRNIE